MQLAQIQGRQNQSNSDFYGTDVSEWQQYKVHVRYCTSKMWYVSSFLPLQDIKEMISFLMCQQLAGMLQKKMGGASRSVENLICNQRFWCYLGILFQIELRPPVGSIGQMLQLSVVLVVPETQSGFSASKAFWDMKNIPCLDEMPVITVLFADWTQSFTASVREMPPASAIPMAGMRPVS